MTKRYLGDVVIYLTNSGQIGDLIDTGYAPQQVDDAGQKAAGIVEKKIPYNLIRCSKRKLITE